MAHHNENILICLLLFFLSPVYVPYFPNKIGGWIPDIHGRGVKGDILKTISERWLSKKNEEKSFAPTTPVPSVQGGQSPIVHWDKGLGWIPKGLVRGVRGSI